MASVFHLACQRRTLDAHAVVAFNPLMKLLRVLGVGTGFVRCALCSCAGALGRWIHWIHRQFVRGGIVPARVVIVAHDQPPLIATHISEKTPVGAAASKPCAAPTPPSPFLASIGRRARRNCDTISG